MERKEKKFLLKGLIQLLIQTTNSQLQVHIREQIILQKI
jgi:hypothetical protein